MTRSRGPRFRLLRLGGRRKGFSGLVEHPASKKRHCTGLPVVYRPADPGFSGKGRVWGFEASMLGVDRCRTPSSMSRLDTGHQFT